MSKTFEISKDCSQADLQGKEEHEIYLMNPKTIAQKKAVLGEYHEKIMCRRHMIKLAAMHGLDLNTDFQSREQVLREKDADRLRLEAYAELLDWIERYDLLPDVGGKPPSLGRQHLCRKCAESFPKEELFVFDKRFLSTLHPDLSGAARAASRLDGRAFCKTHFEEVVVAIHQVEEKHGLRASPVRSDYSYLTLSRLMQLSTRGKNA